jgi:hypothetical protein
MRHNEGYRHRSGAPAPSPRLLVPKAGGSRPWGLLGRRGDQRAQPFGRVGRVELHLVSFPHPWASTLLELVLTRSIASSDDL